MSKPVTRRSQSVVPFGTGAIVEFENEALMLAGLDVWPEAAEVITDERLAQRLGVIQFKMPPPKPERGVSPEGRDHLPYVRFPRWHFCPRCRFLKKASLYSGLRPKCDNQEQSKATGGKQPCGMLAEKSRPRMLPLRFVAVCPAGHIEDFPWNAWAHSTMGQELNREMGCKPPTLYLYVTRGSGLFGLRVACSSCGAERHMGGATSRGGLTGLICKGHRPWLGEEADEVCSVPAEENGQAEMMALQRGASNIYFPAVSSSILIPPFSSTVHRILRERKVWDLLTSSTEDGDVPKAMIKTVATLRNVDAEQLEQAFRMKISGDGKDGGEGIDETEFRFAEYKALQQERRKKDDLLSCRPQEITEYGSVVREYFSHITLVERLAETRVLTGFTRISPSDAEPAKLSRERLDWLPAFRVRGEGIFLRLDERKLSGFEEKADSRITELINRIQLSGRFNLVISRELILLHTLAHILIKRLSYEAGYGASSIRERVYSAPEGHPNRMCGVLLYTAAGDAEGTLGGLVGLGRSGVLEKVLLGALEDIRWCGADPICMESSGQGPGSMNLAACHACALLPETSCELQNRILDRGTVCTFFEQIE